MEPLSSRPPIPPLNPRRKRTQTLLQALGRLEKADGPAPAPTDHPEDPYEERSTFSADESEPKSKMRQRLRKTSSEGGNLAAKARQYAMTAPSPAVPTYSPSPHTPNSAPLQAFHHPPAAPYAPPVHLEGSPVPASAAMF